MSRPPRLTRNAARCLSCGVTLESGHRRDFRTCGCPNQMMVDGGLEYRRYGAANMGLVEDLCEYEDTP